MEKLLFAKDDLASALQAKTRNVAERGPLYSDDQLNFVMHAHDDPEREIHLTMLPFALRTR